MKTINKKMILTGTLALVMSTWFTAHTAQAETCGDPNTALAGSYRGKALTGGAKYDLLVRAVDGRASSYLAVLMTKDESTVNLYILDAVTVGAAFHGARFRHFGRGPGPPCKNDMIRVLCSIPKR